MFIQGKIYPHTMGDIACSIKKIHVFNLNVTLPIDSPQYILQEQSVHQKLEH